MIERQANSIEHHVIRPLRFTWFAAATVAICLLGGGSIVDGVGRGRTLSQILSPLEPSHPAVRLLAHQYSDTFTLTGVPTALANAAECAALVRGERFPRNYPLEYGQGFGLNVRFHTGGGEPPVLRLLWTKESGVWRIVAFDVETP